MRKGLKMNPETAYSLWEYGAREERQLSQPPGKDDKHQENTIPSSDPGEKFPRQSAKMFGKSMRHTKTKYTERGLLHFQNSSPLRKKKRSCTTMSAHVKLNPWKTAIMCSSVP